MKPTRARHHTGIALFCACLLNCISCAAQGAGETGDARPVGGRNYQSPIYETLPLWEIGAGIGYFSFPQYIGSDERTSATLPLPYVVYRGETVNISRDSVSGNLFKTANFVLDISGDFSLPVDSDDNDARAGMPDIDYLLEIGGVARYVLVRNTDARRTVSVELPVRAVFQSDLSYLSHEGWRVNPRLRYREHIGPWRLSFWTGLYWNDRDYNALFYSVEPQYATPERPAFEANGGFGGWAVSSGLTYRYKDLWVGGFLRYHNIEDTDFSDSPLVVRQSNLSFGLGFAWIFAKSRQRVPRWRWQTAQHQRADDRLALVAP